jgi:hypothetical protein
MKPLISSCIFALYFGLIGFAQDKKTTKKGEIIFEASVPSFEEIKATHEKVSCVLNIKTGEINSLALVKEFHFKIPLMEEHFNSNFIESNRYPKATFKGVLENFDINKIGMSPKEFKLKGKLKLHGKSKIITQTAIVRTVNDGVEIVTVFDIIASDFNIHIPEILNQKISKTITLKTVFLVK